LRHLRRFLKISHPPVDTVDRDVYAYHGLSASRFIHPCNSIQDAGPKNLRLVIRLITGELLPMKDRPGDGVAPSSSISAFSLTRRLRGVMGHFWKIFAVTSLVAGLCVGYRAFS